jgi:hypothetical protein
LRYVIRSVRNDVQSNWRGSRSGRNGQICRRAVDILAAAGYGDYAGTVVDDIDALARRRLGTGGNQRNRESSRSDRDGLAGRKVSSENLIRRGLRISDKQRKRGSGVIGCESDCG